MANFTANRIEVVSLASAAVERSMNVTGQPSSLALSPDGRWLLVAHYGNFASPGLPRNALTLIDLQTNARQQFALASAPFGVAFGAAGLALVVTATEFLEFDPAAGAARVLDTIQNVTANTLPRPAASPPASIVAASVAASGDGRFIYGLSDTLRFRYEVATKRLTSLGYTSSPPFGPRSINVNRDGSTYVMGWGLFNQRGTLIAQFADPAGLLGVGGHAIDSARGVIYAQVPDSRSATTTNLPPPALRVVDAENLAVRETLSIPENLSGKSVFSGDGSTLYSISDSGVTVFPVGRLSEHRRVGAVEEDVVIQANACDRRLLRATFTVTDLSGQATAFSAAASIPGIRLTQSSPTTPATVEVTVDPAALLARPGTVAAQITISAPESVRVPDPVRLLVQLRESDQRGTILNIPGKLVDLLADPARDRFYVLRQDRNQMLVFDGTSYRQIAALKTGNTPVQMAMSFDHRYLMVGNNNSQIANVYDLDTLTVSDPIVFPGGHYPKSLAASGRAVLAATRVAGPVHTIDRVDFWSRTAQQLTSLGVWENNIHIDTALVASGNGAMIMAAQADGNLLLYDGNADTFTVSRRDTDRHGGAYAASATGQFVVGNSLLNSSLVTTRRFGSATDVATGFQFLDGGALRATSGVLERVSLETGAAMRPTRTAETPPAADPSQVFTRTVAPLANRRAIATLTLSGVTLLAWDYDIGVVPPRIDRVVNAADGRAAMAPGALISLFGTNLSPLNLATNEMPLPTALGESCLTINGAPVPVLFVSPTQINAQVPFTISGSASLILRTPGGVSDTFLSTISATAPSIFQLSIQGLDGTTPAIYNGRNGALASGSNPLKRGDRITIYLTGMGRTLPEVAAGSPAPGSPAAVATAAPRVSLGGAELPIDFAGLTPGLAGVYQINAQVSRSAPAGMTIPLEIVQPGGTASVMVRVIE